MTYLLHTYAIYPILHVFQAMTRIHVVAPGVYHTAASQPSLQQHIIEEYGYGIGDLIFFGDPLISEDLTKRSKYAWISMNGHFEQPDFYPDYPDAIVCPIHITEHMTKISQFVYRKNVFMPILYHLSPNHTLFMSIPWDNPENKKTDLQQFAQRHGRGPHGSSLSFMAYKGTMYCHVECPDYIEMNQRIRFTRSWEIASWEVKSKYDAARDITMIMSILLREYIYYDVRLHGNGTSILDTATGFFTHGVSLREGYTHVYERSIKDNKYMIHMGVWMPQGTQRAFTTLWDWMGEYVPEISVHCY